MRWEFYPKLAFDGIRKNRRLYIPYLCTGAGMVAMFYILTFLSENADKAVQTGIATMCAVLKLGTWVVAFFSLLFLFYTNSFLMRRRKREFGLYNMLGMGKGNLSVVLFWENVFVAVFSLAAGLIVGIALSKLAELGMVRLLQGETAFDFSVSITGICHTVTVFAPIFLLLYLNGLRQIRFSTAIALMRSENTGEKPPKGNWFLGLFGLLLLGAAYFMAVTIGDPVSALLLFFGAVIMVIAATYLLMIAGAVLLCRILQRNKRYYYKPNHFVSVSSMVYRMKRNGAGLASICILATMVLVMLSSTTALYFGGEDALLERFPREINLWMYFPDIESISSENVDSIRTNLRGTVWKHGLEPKNLLDYRCITFTASLQDGVLSIQLRPDQLISHMVQVQLIPLSDFNAITGAGKALAEGEVLVSAYRTRLSGDTVSFSDGPAFRVKEQMEDLVLGREQAASILPSLILVTPDFDETAAALARGDEVGALDPRWTYSFDAGLDEEAERALFQDLIDRVKKISWDGQTAGYSYERRNAQREDFYGTYGGFLYLGILLSIVFLFATALIIYYKQITEGYEDQSRFDLMQKVGMTKREIRKSVNSQLLTVFFLPLLGAGLHMAFAFPMLRKILLLFNLNNAPLFALTTGVSFLAFACFYMLVYRGTSNVYYKIVSGAGDMR